MILRMLEVGPIMVNCYIVGDEETKEAVVFDPGGNVDQILKVQVVDVESGVSRAVYIQFQGGMTPEGVRQAYGRNRKMTVD